MASVACITEAELLDALATAATGSAPEDARTVSEMAAATGIHERRIRVALRVLTAEGRVGVHTVTRRALDGRMSRVPAYTVAPAATTAKATAKATPRPKSPRAR